ncbi:DNA translocase FtsK [Sporosarcina cyprini]|uniref:DNA translocase FtsK n=1 Tax=Sporosarcina cyprini TaxID=2910523 RepID=UPI001EE05549|nr:DNA translocase FtsK [Sporosarcina cyprini]MCG3089446.1 DNA translocase FtsK [Sporosarcina cyprini]
MERVIMLTWFKRVLNRIVKSDKDYETDTENEIEYEYEYEHEQVTNEHQQERESDRERTHPPSFRFPIITDAEIYGWDDEEPIDRLKPSAPPQEMLEDDGFEPVPLYQNERWPGKNERVTIHRTETERRLDKSALRMTGATIEAATEPKQEKKEKVKPVRNRPFTPTQVPSPVYGFRAPKRTVLEEEQLPIPRSHAEKTGVHNDWADPNALSNDETNLPVQEREDSTSYGDFANPSSFADVQAKEQMHDQKDMKAFEADGFQEEQSPLNEEPFVHSLEEEAENAEAMEVEAPTYEKEDHVVSSKVDVEREEHVVINHTNDEMKEHEVSGEMVDLNENHSDSRIGLTEEYPVASESEVEPEGMVGIGESKNVTGEQFAISGSNDELEDHSAVSEVIDAKDFTASNDSNNEMIIHTSINEAIEKTEDFTANSDSQHETVNHTAINDSSDESEQYPAEEDPEDMAENNEAFREVKEVPVASGQMDVEPVLDPAEESAIERPAEREKVVPFNVLMLKSDKMKNDKPVERIEPVTQSANAKKETVEETIEPIEEEEEPYYAFPSLDLLIQPEEHIEDVEWLESQSVKLEEALSYFSIQANVMEAVQGPTVTRFELTVGHGTKVSKIRNLTDDLKLALAAEDIRIQAPIPGTSSIGIEIPNRRTRAVRISEVIQTERFRQSTSPLEAVLGLSLTGEPVTLDLRKMPHGMIAGATGSGKSVCINSILTSLMYKASPTDVKLLLIDPKMVELAPYDGVPHLLSPVITDVKAATAALKWAVDEMERRYELFAHAGARNIERYNEMVTGSRQFSLKMPYLLIVIDELADLMMMAPADVEVSISRITQKARACGIHLIIATQRPSVDVITGTIKANVPTRIAFSVSSQVDSRTIIDTPGAERLLGKGDMLYLGNGQSSSVRLQGTFVTDEEIERIIEHVQNEAKPVYLFGQEDLLANSIEEEETDPLFEEACKFIIEHGSASTSLLQRNFGIGYNRAAKLMDKMEKLSFISEQKGSKPRDVYLTQQEFEQYVNRFEQN